MTCPEPKGLSETARGLYESRCRAVASLMVPSQSAGFTRFETQWQVRRWSDGYEVAHQPYMGGVPWETLGRFESAEQAMRAIYAYEDAR